MAELLPEAQRLGIGFGARVHNASSRPEYDNLIKNVFNVHTVGTYWGSTEPRPGEFHYGHIDPIINKAEEHGADVHIHPVFYATPSSEPGWLKRHVRDKKEVRNFITRRAKGVVGHYRSRVKYIDVVNEAFESDARFRESVLYKTLGPDFVPQCFEACAHQDPDAHLIYNEYGLEMARHGRKWDAVYNLLKELVTTGVPIHGLGWQMHIREDWSHPSPKEIVEDQNNIQARMKMVSDLGLVNHFTEIDVRGVSEEYQGRVYAKLMEYLIESGEQGQSTFTSWGVTDAWDWQNTNGLLFREDYSPKPAVDRLFDVMATYGHSEPSPDPPIDIPTWDELAHQVSQTVDDVAAINDILDDLEARLSSMAAALTSVDSELTMLIRGIRDAVTTD